MPRCRALSVKGYAAALLGLAVDKSKKGTLELPEMSAWARSDNFYADKSSAVDTIQRDAAQLASMAEAQRAARSQLAEEVVGMFKQALDSTVAGIEGIYNYELQVKETLKAQEAAAKGKASGI